MPGAPVGVGRCRVRLRDFHGPGARVAIRVPWSTWANGARALRFANRQIALRSAGGLNIRLGRFGRLTCVPGGYGVRRISFHFESKAQTCYASGAAVRSTSRGAGRIDPHPRGACNRPWLQRLAAFAGEVDQCRTAPDQHSRYAMTALPMRYARCSTDEQDLTVQREGLAPLGVTSGLDLRRSRIDRLQPRTTGPAGSIGRLPRG